jgi:hypothetical protein
MRRTVLFLTAAGGCLLLVACDSVPCKPFIAECDMRHGSCQRRAQVALACLRETQGPLPEVQFLEPDEVVGGASDTDMAEDEAEPDEVSARAFRHALRRFGLLPSDAGVRQAFAREAQRQLGAWYVSSTDTIYFRELDPPSHPQTDFALFVHELVHAHQVAADVPGPASDTT